MRGKTKKLCVEDKSFFSAFEREWAQLKAKTAMILPRPLKKRDLGW